MVSTKQLAAALLVLLTASAGCQTGANSKADGWKFRELFSMEQGLPWHDDEDDEPPIGMPVRVVDAWTDTVLHRAGQLSQRGFGGRLHFYGADSNAPIRVDGQLVIYAFDEAGRDPTDNRPTKRYVFPAEQLARHMSESKLGPSYSVWLPWDAVGGPNKDVSLICRFEPRGGTIIVGEQTRQRLPGVMVAKKSPPKMEAADAGVRPAVHQAGAEDNSAAAASFNTRVPQHAAERQEMTTTTISLPPRPGR